METDKQFNQRLGIDYSSNECITRYEEWSNSIRSDILKSFPKLFTREKPRDNRGHTPFVWKDIHEIRRLYKGGMSFRAIARKYDVDRSSITGICRNTTKIWKV